MNKLSGFVVLHILLSGAEPSLLKLEFRLMYSQMILGFISNQGVKFEQTDRI
jgi:hypothetical protein